MDRGQGRARRTRPEGTRGITERSQCVEHRIQLGRWNLLDEAEDCFLAFPGHHTHDLLADRGQCDQHLASVLLTLGPSDQTLLHEAVAQPRQGRPVDAEDLGEDTDREWAPLGQDEERTALRQRHTLRQVEERAVRHSHQHPGRSEDSIDEEIGLIEVIVRRWHRRDLAPNRSRHASDDSGGLVPALPEAIEDLASLGEASFRRRPAGSGICNGRPPHGLDCTEGRPPPNR